MSCGRDAEVLVEEAEEVGFGLGLVLRLRRCRPAG